MKKRQFIANFKRDDVVSDIFAVKFKKPVEPYKNGYRFELRLADKTKEIMYKYWGPNDENKVKGLYNSIKKDDVVFVTGRVNEWNDNLEISGNERDRIEVVQDYEIEDFIRETDKNVDEMWNELMGYINSVGNHEIKRVLEYFFKDDDFSKRFKRWPAAMYIHHGWLGGLLEHSLSVVRILEGFHKVHKDMDMDLLIAGGLLHDIGKLREFDIKTTINMTKEGMLLGHVSIAIEMLDKAFESLDVSEEIRTKLKHIILTHMGEYGSTKTPSFPEAMAVYYADQADATLTQMEDFIKEANTEDEFVYSKHLGNVYLK